MGTAEGMIAQARALLGVREEPPGSNRNLVTRWYGMTGPWCDMSISFAAGHSDNLDAVLGKFAWTVAHAKAFRDHGRFHYGLGGCRRGDILFLDWSGRRSLDGIDHVALVEAAHSDGTVTTLEGNTSDRFMRRVRDASCVVGYGRPLYRDSTPMPATDGMLRRGSRGGAVLALQRKLNTVLAAGLAVDGDFGPKTEAAVRALQRRFGIPVDGEYGPRSAAVLAAALAGRREPAAPAPRPPAGPLAVDGDFGPATCAALQRALVGHGAHLVVDGSFGPRTTVALQRHLQVTADGEFGPKSVAALQRHVGSTPDGEWGPDTTRHLQAALNAHRF
jgi:peptidoglycan hydrolase-like protein with peptidoglycan-binding domain